ncbi:MAG: redox-sensing transcriptional repressor Rex, partial [Candidatus Hydrogenedentes bacterium]|nr:redox-sensing transcriptional repressor Rex [Candidatus Hydrogenedentota bacterium]
LLNYFTDRNHKLSISAAFDTDPSKIGRVISGCHCHGLDDLADVIARERILTGILAVPAGAAQEIATRLYNAGIRGIVNFAPIRLSLPPGVYVENLDMTTALEKVAFFARQQESNAESS